MRTLTRDGSTRRRAQNPDRRSLYDGSAYVRERRQHQNVVTSRAQLLRFHNLRSCSAKHAPRFHLNARGWSLTSRRSAHNRRPRGQNADRRALHEHRSGQNGHRSAKNGRRCASTISPRDDRHFARPEGRSNLGGAVASQLRIGAPLLSHTLFPIYVVALLWGALYIRETRLRQLVPVRR